MVGPRTNSINVTVLSNFRRIEYMPFRLTTPRAERPSSVNAGAKWHVCTHCNPRVIPQYVQHSCGGFRPPPILHPPFRCSETGFSWIVPFLRICSCLRCHRQSDRPTVVSYSRVARDGDAHQRTLPTHIQRRARCDFHIKYCP